MSEIHSAAETSANLYEVWKDAFFSSKVSLKSLTNFSSYQQEETMPHRDINLKGKWYLNWSDVYVGVKWSIALCIFSLK